MAAINLTPEVIPGKRLVDGQNLIDIANLLNAQAAGTNTANNVTGLYVHGSAATGLTAAGTTTADALQLAAQINNVTTAAASTGVKLPTAAAVGVGGTVTIYNNGANPVQVYSTETIDGIAGATGVPLTNAKRCIYTAISATAWLSAQLGVVSA